MKGITMSPKTMGYVLIGGGVVLIFLGWKHIK